jgi:hypothetical protein
MLMPWQQTKQGGERESESGGAVAASSGGREGGRVAATAQGESRARV